MYSLWRSMGRALGFGRHQIKVSPRNVVFITGCDSGLGFALAVYCYGLDMTVISACRNLNSEGARLLRAMKGPGNRMVTLEMDLLKRETITRAHERVMEMLRNGNAGKDYVFSALVNNAGVMCFGEFEWQTPEQYEMQIQVNLLGTMHLTKKFLPLVRQHRARIINVTSHCGLQALPALAPYAASKAGLRFWTDSLRIEMQQYGVDVINFIPGSFVMASNIAARQQDYAEQMLNAFTPEQRQFYGEYFTKFNDYLAVVSGAKAPNQVHDAAMMVKFKDALTSSRPRAMYIHEPWRYKIYRILFSVCPTPIVDWLTVKFCAMPTYREATTNRPSMNRTSKTME